jgi:symplekin
MDACSVCFSPLLRELFTADALAVALQQLVELVPLPLLFMRTVIQTATVAPKLHGFILDLLSKLVLKQVWKTDAKLWQGVLRCAKQLVPRSFPVYLQLPAAQLTEALEQSPDLATPLKAYASTPAVRPTVPGATLELLAAAAPDT